ncbi:DUF4352 domain-containing protein [Streptomyces sp. NPDC059441]|uniref:DUF4352 domain-containing protein n=1 Tax=Streptomyces sp. NPDC059441 TaxID=3346829 RepID=UPI003691B818
MSYGKSTISSNLNGKVSQEQFVLDLVEAVVREPRMKQHVLTEARRLWKAADKPPAPTGVAAGQTSALALAHRTNEQLVTVYERNQELERERTGAHQLVLVLVRLVGHLQDQVDELGHRPDAAAELDAVHEQLRVAKQELERARQLEGTDDGSKLDVTVVKVVDPAKGADEFTTAESGKRFVGVQFRLVNTGTIAYNDSPSNGAQLADKDGQHFESTFGDISAGPSMASEVKLKPGGKALGWIVFEVPKASKVSVVQFGMDSGFAEQTGEWKLS